MTSVDFLSHKLLFAAGTQ